MTSEPHHGGELLVTTRMEKVDGGKMGKLFILGDDRSLIEIDEEMVDLRELRDSRGPFRLLGYELVIFHRPKDVVYRLKPRKLRTLITEAPDPNRFREYCVRHPALFNGDQFIISYVEKGEEFCLAELCFGWKDGQITPIP